MQKVKSFLSDNVLLLVIIVLVAICASMNSTFLTWFNLGNLMIEISYMAFLAMGMAFVVLTGEIDLTQGAMAGFSTVIVTLVLKNFNVGNDVITCVLACVLSILVCGVMGYISGHLVKTLKFPSLIATLGMSWIINGLGDSLIHGTPIPLSVDGYSKVVKYKLFGKLPVTFLLAIVVLFIFMWLLDRTKWGREFYATGSNEYSAHISGVKTKKVVRVAFVISAVCASIGGLIIAASVNSGYPDAATDYETYAIAAVVMGGISMTGGEGKIGQAFYGIIILRLLNKLVIFTGISNASGYIEGTIVGILLLVVLLSNELRKRGGKARG